jgi:hypothetical protein
MLTLEILGRTYIFEPILHPFDNFAGLSVVAYEQLLEYKS